MSDSDYSAFDHEKTLLPVDPKEIIPTDSGLPVVAEYGVMLPATTFEDYIGKLATSDSIVLRQTSSGPYEFVADSRTLHRDGRHVSLIGVIFNPDSTYQEANLYVKMPRQGSFAHYIRRLLDRGEPQVNINVEARAVQSLE